VVCSLAGRRTVAGRGEGGVEDAERLGAALADELADRGAAAILAEIRAAAETPR
jgi:hypothetical protein